MTPGFRLPSYGQVLELRLHSVYQHRSVRIGFMLASVACAAFPACVSTETASSGANRNPLLNRP